MKISRKMIGFVTSGQYSFLKNFAIGIGNIFEKIDFSDSFFILIRNPNSRHYLFAECEKY